MQIEIYCFTAKERSISAELMAICDSFSSLLWDVEYYKCGCFEVYIAANAKMWRFSGQEESSGVMMTRNTSASSSRYKLIPMQKMVII